MIPRFLQGILGIPRFRKPSFDVLAVPLKILTISKCTCVLVSFQDSFKDPKLCV